MLLNPSDFYRMTDAIFAGMVANRITTVEQLAAMTPAQIDALPIRGIGKALSVRWHQTAIDLLAAQPAPLPAPAAAPRAIARTFVIQQVLTCDTLCSTLTGRLALTGTAANPQLTCDGALIAELAAPVLGIAPVGDGLIPCAKLCDYLDQALSLTNDGTDIVLSCGTTEIGRVSPTANQCTTHGIIPGTTSAPFTVGPCIGLDSLDQIKACLTWHGYTVSIADTGTTTPISVQSTWFNETPVAGQTSYAYSNQQGTLGINVVTDPGTVLGGTDQQVGTFQHISTNAPTTAMGLTYNITNTTGDPMVPTFVIDPNSGTYQYNLTALTLDYDQSRWDAVVTVAAFGGRPVGTILDSGVTYPTTAGAYKIEFRPKPGITLAPGETTAIHWRQTWGSAINFESNGISASYTQDLPDKEITITGPTCLESLTGNGTTIPLGIVP